MSSSDPPSRIPPRGHSNPETKSVRDELSSKGKVEKVREVDADETRKRRFQKFFEEDQVTNAEGDLHPSPFELYRQTTQGRNSPIDDTQEAIVPSPSYTPPPNVTPIEETDEEGDATTKALPQSHDFWEEVDFPPDQPVPPKQMQEVPDSAKRTGKKGDSEDKGTNGPIGKGTKKVAGKIVGKEGGVPPLVQQRAVKTEKEKKLPSPFETIASRPEELQEKGRSSKGNKKREDEESPSLAELRVVSFPQEEHREREQNKEKERKLSVELAALPPFSEAIQPAAMAATVQATPYLSPSTIPLFFQMAGTIYVMTTSGISRTEIVLNQPTYANSRFFGATITIEKYATAPDSFNIRLTGSNHAIVTFKENIPSLMAAFQNGHFDFKINRIDVEYRMERPVFRRKEKGEDRGETGGDLGERRK